MRPRPPSSTRSDTLCPYPTPLRSLAVGIGLLPFDRQAVEIDRTAEHRRAHQLAEDEITLAGGALDRQQFLQLRVRGQRGLAVVALRAQPGQHGVLLGVLDRKSTRLNSSH